MKSFIASFPCLYNIYDITNGCNDAKNIGETIKAISDEFRCVASTGGYKKEYELGDVVTVFKPEWGVTKNMRLEKVTENTTGAGFEIIPVFGEPFPAE